MPWVYNSANGVLSHEGRLIGVGYSGHDEGVNNPLVNNLHGIGPIPCGIWSIGDPVEHPQLGPLAFPLMPQENTETYGRSGFFIHGDSLEHPGAEQASHGCIVMPRNIRLAILNSSDRVLEVV